MQLERQDTFGWLLSVEVFLAGSGGGAFLSSFIINLLGRLQTIAKEGMMVGMSLVIIGAILLFIELRNKKLVYRIAMNPSSWIARGTWFLTLFIVSGLIYLFLGYGVQLKIDSTGVMVFGWFAALCAVFVMSYTGFLLGAAKRVPLWNNSGLPVLFFFSSLTTGTAIILVMAALLETSLVEVLRPLVVAQMILVFLQMIVLGTFLGMAAYGGSTVLESVHLLIKNPLFIACVIVIGLLIPLALLGYLALVNHAFMLSIPAGIFLLIGGFYLRVGILRAGIRLPVSAF